LGFGGCLTDKALLERNPNFPVDDFPLVKEYEYNLARVDVNGSNYRDLACLESARAPDWNAAGVVYQSSAGLQITDDTPQAENRLLVHDPLKPAYEDPDWQPNGERIVFMGREASHWEIFAINADGSGMAALTRPVTTLVDELPSNVAPAWSPDGQHIVYLSNRSKDHSAGPWRLWVMNADGSHQHPLPVDLAIEYTYGNEQAVSWGL
jgi:dipeptidyl aminopeptidase/acylaminoacyl peptidase